MVNATMLQCVCKIYYRLSEGVDKQREIDMKMKRKGMMRSLGPITTGGR